MSAPLSTAAVLLTPPAPAFQAPASTIASVTGVTFIPVTELALLLPEDQTPAGPVTLRGLYGRYGEGDRSLYACRREESALKCARYAMNLPTVGPALLEVDAQIEAGQANIISWRPVVNDLSASQAVAQLALAAAADQVAALDWASIARADFVESSAQHRWDAQAVRDAVPELFSYDMATNRVIWRVQGLDMPEQKPLVTRYPVLYLFTSLDGLASADVLATIEGFVLE
jgi:hypothetical protein